MIPYQGSKDRFADKIIDFINPDPSKKFYDMCCGTGAIATRLVERGFDLTKIVMVDAGPWGLFWKRVGDGTFSIKRFGQIAEAFSRSNHVEWCKINREIPVDDEDSVYRFLLLQICSWGGAPVKFNKRNTFSTVGFRTKPSPTVEQLFGRVVVAVERMTGVDGRLEFVESVITEPDATVYYDPPYGDKSVYTADLRPKQIPQRDFFISYHMELSSNALQIDRNRTVKIGGHCYDSYEYLSKVSR